MKTCRVCGKKNLDDAVVCGACRTPFERKSVATGSTAQNGNLRANQGNLEDLARDALNKTVAINCLFANRDGKVYHGAGTGFIVENGYIVTNAHVVEIDQHVVGAKLTASFDKSIDSVEYDVEIVGAFVEADLAILKFTSTVGQNVAKRNFFKIRTSPLKFGEKVYTVGNSLGCGLGVRKGIVAIPKSEERHRGVTDLIQVDFDIKPGNSGGALLDYNNQVVGVTTLGKYIIQGPIDSHIDLCVPAKFVKKLLDSLGG